jgi:predicted AlkP superfamily pyrophosphatase or phosphodiesterase
MSHRIFKFLNVLLIVGSGIVAQNRAWAALENSDRIVVMVSIDGLAAYYFDDPKAEMPNIRALAAEGARATAMKASTPTVTWPNHTTLVTGVPPAKHGVVGNNFFDRTSLKKVILIADPVLDKDQIVKVPTIYDVAKTAGLKTAAVRWPATRNAKALDWMVPDMRTLEETTKYATPSLLQESDLKSVLLPDKPAAKGQSDASRDRACTVVFEKIVKEHRPNLALLHLEDVDHNEHLHGPRSPEAYAAVKEADACVGEVWKQLQKQFPGKATIVVVSDHGFSPIKRTILPTVILRQAGLIAAKPNKGNAEPIYILSQGGAAMVYIMDQSHRAELKEQVKKTFKSIEGVSKIVGTEQLKDYGVASPDVDPHGPDMMLFADEGYSFGDTAAGQLPFVDKPERLGSHGHDASLPDLHATFVACGVGIKPGTKLGEIENTSVAPTLAKLLKVSLPVESKPLPVFSKQ